MSEQVHTIQSNPIIDDKFRQIQFLYKELLKDDNSFSYMMEVFSDSCKKEKQS
jgi:hypothetical protein